MVSGFHLPTDLDTLVLVYHLTNKIKLPLFLVTVIFLVLFLEELLFCEITFSSVFLFPGSMQILFLNNSFLYKAHRLQYVFHMHLYLSKIKKKSFGFYMLHEKIQCYDGFIFIIFFLQLSFIHRLEARVTNYGSGKLVQERYILKTF